MKLRWGLVAVVAVSLTVPVGVPVAQGSELPGAPGRISWVVDTERVNDGDVVIRWTAPEDDGGEAIIAYEIQQTKDGQWINLYSFEVQGQPLALRITGLPRGNVYRFRIAAVTEVGQGPWTESPDVGVRTVPSAPRQVDWSLSRQGPLSLRWRSPKSSGGPLPLGDLAIHLWGFYIEETKDGVTWTDVGYVPINQVARWDSTTYRAHERVAYRVSALNEVGRGAPSDMSRWFEPTIAMPQPVTGLDVQFRPLENGKVAATITWVAGYDGGSPAKYHVSVSVNGKRRISEKEFTVTKVTVTNIPRRHGVNRANPEGFPSEVYVLVWPRNAKYYADDFQSKLFTVPPT